MSEIYAINTFVDGWVILHGWSGCQVGQGEVLERHVSDKDLRDRMQYYEQKEKKK